MLSLFSQYSYYWLVSFEKTVWTLVIFLIADGWLDPNNDLVDASQRYRAWIIIRTPSSVSLSTVYLLRTKNQKKEKKINVKKKVETKIKMTKNLNMM